MGETWSDCLQFVVRLDRDYFETIMLSIFVEIIILHGPMNPGTLEADLGRSWCDDRYIPNRRMPI